MKHRVALASLLALAFAAAPVHVRAQPRQVTIAYQDTAVPFRVAQETRALEAATGYKVVWRQFFGSGEVVRAMASGAVQVGEAGSAAIATAVSRGDPIELFWILDDIGSVEALVARNGSGIRDVADLRGRRIGVPFNSRAHFHVLVALDQAMLGPADVQLVDMRPAEIRSAWRRGDVDAAFVGDPVLADVRRSGKVITTSGRLSASTGKATFDGYVARRDFASENHDFMVKLVETLAAADDGYRRDRARFSPDSAEVRAIAKWSGIKAEDVPVVLSRYRFPSAQEQATKWLGGGKGSMAATSLAATAAFLLSRQQIEAALPDYAAAINAEFVRAVAK